jgi:voltage-gated potassium channel Kch
VPSLNVVERRMNRFLRNPASVRGALSVIVLATALVVVGAGILMRLIDHEEYGSIWVGMWWAVQTVTTVGYGDVTPQDPNGRIVATFVMFEGIAFLAIITAAITSTFVERASRQRQRKEEAEQERIDTRFDELDRRLDQIEETLRRALSK